MANKGFLNSSSDSFSVRIPGSAEMVLAIGRGDWRDVGHATINTQSFKSKEAVPTLHGSIYLERPDVGAIVVSSPKGARLLAGIGGILPPLFDEQVRHIGLSMTHLAEDPLTRERIHKAFRRGANAALLRERLLCLGMTCERAIFNTELFEKCAQAYVIAKASGSPSGVIPAWVRLIANRRLLKDECNAAARYLNGQLPENNTTY